MGDNERLCVMESRLQLKRSSPQAELEPSRHALNLHPHGLVNRPVWSPFLQWGSIDMSRIALLYVSTPFTVV